VNFGNRLRFNFARVSHAIAVRVRLPPVSPIATVEPGRTVVASIAHSVAYSTVVTVILIRVGNQGAVVAGVADTVTIAVELTGVGSPFAVVRFVIDTVAVTVVVNVGYLIVFGVRRWWWRR
jgi:hypothetical protein